jgi:hypothetical protein
MTDEEVYVGVVDDPDAKPADEAFGKDALVVMPRRKESVTIRLDATLCSGLAAIAAIKRASTPSFGRI